MSRPSSPNPARPPDHGVEPPSTPWARPVAEAVAGLATDTGGGLTDSEAARRLAAHGPNRLDATPPEPAWRRVARQFRDPLVVLLIGAIAVSATAWMIEGGEGTPVEAIVIAAIVVLNALIGAWQEARAERAVAALQQMAGTRTTVVRGGVARPVPSAELVPGDIVVLAAGDAVGADCRLAESASLEVAEASLTGESVPVAKTTAAVPVVAGLADRTSMAFAGTAVTGGRGRGIVVATGMDTEIGRIAALLDSTGADITPLQREMRWLGRMLGRVVVVLSAAVVGVIVATSEITDFADMVDALLVGVSLAVAAVPEGLPAILTVVLALGVQRMAERRAVVKRLASVETLGAATAICTDKTGTLTRNEMSIVAVWTPSGSVEVTGSGYDPSGELRRAGAPVDAGDPVAGAVRELVAAGSMANDATFEPDGEGGWRVAGDPTEIAFLVARHKLGAGDAADRGADLGPDLGAARLAELPFDAERRMMSVAATDTIGFGGGERGDVVLLAKGAPEAVLDRCRSVGGPGDLGPAERSRIEVAVDGFADRGLRTLAVAYRPLAAAPGAGRDPDLDPDLDSGAERDLVLLGVAGIVDPPRPEAARAVAEVERGGGRVVMITGDHPRTAHRIGAELGIAGAAPPVTGRELGGLDDAALDAVVARTDVFARVEPSDKLRIVRSLQRGGHITAMTGDGVNDAPALQQADIGVAMGITGTEVAKEASDMILADDNFATIVSAVREGREIFANIGKFLRYLLASNAGEVLVVVLGVVLAGVVGLDAAGGDGELAVPLLATQILWINLLTDSALALALGVDPPVDDVMANPPRRIGARVIDGPMVVTIGLVGATTALAGLVALDVGLAGGVLGGDGDIGTARTMVFTTLVLAQVANAFNARSDRVSALVRPFDNRLLWGAAAATVAAQVLVVHFPPLGRAFETRPLSIGEWITCAALATSVLAVEEVHKLVRRTTPRRRR